LTARWPSLYLGGALEHALSIRIELTSIAPVLALAAKLAPAMIGAANAEVLNEAVRGE